MLETKGENISRDRSGSCFSIIINMSGRLVEARVYTEGEVPGFGSHPVTEVQRQDCGLNPNSCGYFNKGNCWLDIGPGRNKELYIKLDETSRTIGTRTIKCGLIDLVEDLSKTT